MEDQDLRLTPTHGSQEHHGTVFGIELPFFRWVALALLAGLALLIALSSQTGLLDAAPWAAAPVALVILYLRFFQQGKPPGYALDLLEQTLTGGHAQPPIHPPPSDDEHSAS